VAKLRESALSKANRVESARYIDCSEQKTAPTPPPASSPSKAATTGEQPGTTRPPPAKGAAAPVGGPQPGSGCTEKERTERRLRIQDEILRLEAELIPIDGTKPEGRARQLQLRREIDRLAELMKSDCPPLLGGSQLPAPKQAVEPPMGPTAPLGGGKLLTIPRDPFDEFEDEADEALEDLDDAMDDCDEDAVKKLIPKLEELAKRARQTAKAAQAAGKYRKVDPLRASLLAKELENALADAKKFKCLKIRPSNMSNDWGQYRLCQGGAWTGTWGGMPSEAKTVFRNCTTPGTEDTAWQLLSLHNRERAAVGALPLRWNIKLQIDATAYAQQLARTGQLVHAPREGRGIERENLGQGRISWSPVQIVSNEWSNEKGYFRAGVFPNVCEGEWSQCAHYSQMIWPTTTDLGCGWATGSGFEWIVCRYSPGGNKDGKRVGYMDVAPVVRSIPTFSGGPLLFEKVYSAVLKANRPANPDQLEFGDEAVYYWGVFEYARDFGYSDWAFSTLNKLEFYAQTAREHSIEERSKGGGAIFGDGQAGR
jgi:hypothetical protein